MISVFDYAIEVGSAPRERQLIKSFVGRRRHENCRVLCVNYIHRDHHCVCATLACPEGIANRRQWKAVLRIGYLTRLEAEWEGWLQKVHEAVQGWEDTALAALTSGTQSTKSPPGGLAGRLSVQVVTGAYRPRQPRKRRSQQQRSGTKVGQPVLDPMTAIDCRPVLYLPVSPHPVPNFPPQLHQVDRVTRRDWRDGRDVGRSSLA
jgi:hypothetical protein